MNAAASPNLAGITGLVRRLVMDGALQEPDARRAMEEAAKDKRPVHLYLLEKKLISSVQLAAANAFEFGVPIFDVSSLDLAQAAVKLVDQKLIEQHKALPLFKRGNRLYVGISDPTNTRALDEIKFQANLTVEPILVDEDQLRRTIETALSASDSLGDDMDDAEGLENLELGDTEEEDDAGGVTVGEAHAPFGGEDLAGHASALSRKRCSLPVRVLGSASTKARARGYL